MRLLLLVWMGLNTTVIAKVALLVLVRWSLLIILGLVGVSGMYLISIAPFVHEAPIIALMLIIRRWTAVLEATRVHLVQMWMRVMLKVFFILKFIAISIATVTRVRATLVWLFPVEV